jgi:predicted dehydrogenase
MSPLRFALVGAGFWSHFQLAAWQEHAGASCIAVCDRDRIRAEKLAAARSVSGVYTDVSDMIERERPDLLDIVTDVAGHFPLVCLAAERKVPVICQKPMAASLAECEQLVQTCRNAGVPFAVHENWRWQAPLRRVKQLLVEGVIGNPFRCRIDMISGFNVFANQPNLRTEKRFVIADMGCHLFDLARGYFGEPETVYCRTSRIHSGIQGEDVATAIFGMNQGRTTVTVNMAYAETPLERECFPETLVFIEGPLGSIEVTPGCTVRVTTKGGTNLVRVRPPTFAWANPDYALVHSSIVACQADLLHALTAGTPAETDATDNLKTMRMVFAAYESAQTGQAIPFGR